MVRGMGREWLLRGLGLEARVDVDLQRCRREQDGGRLLEEWYETIEESSLPTVVQKVVSSSLKSKGQDFSFLCPMISMFVVLSRDLTGAVVLRNLIEHEEQEAKLTSKTCRLMDTETSISIENIKMKIKLGSHTTTKKMF